MEVNTLVTHKNFKSLGIGCVSKVMKSSCRVNFGTEDVSTCRNTALVEVDTSKCKTIPFSEIRSLSIANSDKLTGLYIFGNELRRWVGVGWVTERVVTIDDLRKYPRVV